MCEEPIEELNERERMRLRRFERLWAVLSNAVDLDDTALAAVVRSEVTTEYIYIVKSKGGGNASQE